MNLDTMMFTISNLWIIVATALVFIMHLGFAGVEAGLTRSKNTVNILFKNFGVLSIGILSYAFIGFQLMYPGESFVGEFFGLSGIGLDPGADGLTANYNPHYTYWSDFIFQAMFAATAATIHAFLVDSHTWSPPPTRPRIDGPLMLLSLLRPD